MSELSNPFLYNCWYAAAWTHEIPGGEKLARVYLDKPIVIYQGESGNYIALDNRCCHRGAPLSLGRIEGECIRCMYHGLKYDADGVVIEIPNCGEPGFHSHPHACVSVSMQNQLRLLIW